MSNRARAVVARVALPAVFFVIVVAAGCGGGGAHPITEFALPAMSSNPIGITAGPDGSLWFTKNNGARIGRITPAGQIDEFAGAVTDYGIAVGPDGSIWFTEGGSNKIGCLTPAGNVTHYPIPTEYSSPRAIAVAANGSIWFTEYSGGKIGRITP